MDTIIQDGSGNFVPHESKSPLKRLESVPGVGSVVGIFTGKFPSSLGEAIFFDITDAAVGLIPVAGDVGTGIMRDIRYVFNKNLSPAFKAELEAITTSDIIVGFIPGVGDIIDFAMFTNTYAYGRKKMIDRAIKLSKTAIANAKVELKSNASDSTRAKIDKIEKFAIKVEDVNKRYKRVQRVVGVAV